jgi:acyl-ACP thioesterase
MAEITTYKYRVEPQDVDFTLRASVGSIINYMLNVAGLDAHNKGFGVEVLQGNSFTWVLSRLAIEVKRQPEQYADIEIDTWVNEFNRLTTTRNFRLHVGEEMHAEGVSQWCVIDMASRQAVDLNIFKDIYCRALVDEASPIAAPARLLGITPTATMSRPVVYSDLDFNRHMNTLRYVDLIFDTLPLEQFERGDAMRLDINFLAEARYGEVVSVGYLDVDNTRQFEISSDADKVLCRAKIEFK